MCIRDSTPSEPLGTSRTTPVVARSGTRRQHRTRPSGASGPQFQAAPDPAQFKLRMPGSSVHVLGS
eukprot:228503-Alexandrium_andersonii.AAC.1